MTLSNSLLKEFADAVSQSDTQETATTCQGTVVKQDGELYVRMAGSSGLTPVISSVEYKEGDTVIVTIQNHTAMIIDNLTDPSSSMTRANNASKVATNYVENRPDEGLIVGDLTGESDIYTCITNAAYYLKRAITDGDPEILATFSRLGLKLGESDLKDGDQIVVDLAGKSKLWCWYDVDGKTPTALECLGNLYLKSGNSQIVFTDSATASENHIDFRAGSSGKGYFTFIGDAEFQKNVSFGKKPVYVNSDFEDVPFLFTDDAFKYGSYTTASKSFSANTDYTLTLKNLGIPDGYRLSAIKGVTSGSSKIDILQFNAALSSTSGDYITVKIRNNSSSAVSTTITVGFFAVKLDKYPSISTDNVTATWS